MLRLSLALLSRFATRPSGYIRMAQGLANGKSFRTAAKPLITADLPRTARKLTYVKARLGRSSKALAS